MGTEQGRTRQLHVAGRYLHNIIGRRFGKQSKFDWLFQSHIGIKGIVYNSVTKQGISNAVIHVKNITGGPVREIQHDVTSGMYRL